MAKKKVKKAVLKRKATPKRKTTKKKVISKKTIEKKKLKTSKLLLWSLIVFVISFTLYLATTIEPLNSFFGFIAILAGSIFGLSVILELIFWILGKAGKK